MNNAIQKLDYDRNSAIQKPSAPVICAWCKKSKPGIKPYEWYNSVRINAMLLCSGCARKAKHQNPALRMSVVLPDSDFLRADRDAVCLSCGRTYGRHAFAPDRLSNDGDPFLHRLCSGRLVKL